MGSKQILIFPLLGLSLFVLLSFPGSSLGATPTSEEDLYAHVFGNASVETALPLIINGKAAGEISAKLKGEKLESISGDALVEKFKILLTQESFDRLRNLEPWVEPRELAYPCEYNPVKLQIELRVPTSALKPHSADLANDPRLKYAGMEYRPAPYGAALNTTLERGYGDDTLGGDNLLGSYDGFVNLKGYVFSARGRYERDYNSEEKGRWVRGDRTLVKDFVPQRLRAQIGDTRSANFGYMAGRQIGGINLRRNFTIDPYTRPYPQGSRNLVLQTPSRVKTYVNGSLIRDERMDAGNYNLANLPLLDGLNFITLEIEDNLGQKRVENFSLSTAVNILRQGELDFSISQGRPYQDAQFSREYTEEQLLSGYFQYGISNSFSAGAYGQSQGDFYLAGLSAGLSTLYGNTFFESATSQLDGEAGSALSVSWRLQKTGQRIGSGFSSFLKYENFQGVFSRNDFLSDAPIRDSLEGSLSLPLVAGITLGLGLGRGRYQDVSLPDREKLNLSMNWRVHTGLNLNVYGSRLTNQFGEANETLSAFLTWDIERGLLSVFRDVKNETTRLSYQSGVYNQLYRPRFDSSIEDGGGGQRGELNALLATPVADFSLRARGAQSADGESFSQGSARISSALLFAYDDEDNEAAFAISRPGTSSFALFKTSENIRGQKIALRSTSPYADNETPIVGDLAFSNLVAYQYRPVEIDPTSLDPGLSLEREKFILLPGYKSAHLIRVKDQGLRSIEGVLMRDGMPISLKIGKIGDTMFFTNREGYFYAEGVSEEDLRISIDGSSKLLSIDSRKKGIIDLGVIQLPKPESRNE